MRRRTLLATALAAPIVAPLARPALAQGERARTLIFVPQANLSSLDAVWTTATVTRNFALMVYDTLYGLDEKLTPSPQMAEGHTSEDEGRRWTIRLREGLKFHDGTPVLARDCTASLARWMKRDSLGQTVAERLDALEAPDDRTLVFRLKRPFAALPFALARSQPNPPVIMPARIAATDAFKQITEVVGSGPFSFVADQFQSGNQAVFARFEGYVPRTEAPSFTAGARRALVERVLWKIIPEPATAANALKTGEVDWLEIPLPDLLASLKSDPGVVVSKLDPYGLYPVLRFNHLQGPTANPGVRRAILGAIDQSEVMQAIMGEDRTAYAIPTGAFVPGTASATDAGMGALAGPTTMAQAQAMLKASGYNGERVVLMHPTDQPFYDAMSQVVAARLKTLGVNVDDAAMDWGTVVQRRAKKDPLDQGGWSLFCTSFPAADYVNPMVVPALRGNGGAAWFGWPNDPKIEELRESWLNTADPAQQKQLAGAIQQEAFLSALYVPLGQYFQSAAWGKGITGHLPGPAPIFWNVAKA